MNRMQVGVRVARQVQTAEHAVDQAMIEVCRLVQTALEGRVEARLAAEVGHEALTQMVQGLNRLAEVRAAVIASHDGLAQIADDHRIGWRLDGTREDKMRPTAVAPFAVAA
ncbi:MULTISPECIES: hypothetical protein [unclassified Brevundimonas]|uniref:hypothetical protein n=1 Tax=unclassified Brevundimonas TaxID=2622653 RepID=UPI002002D289|nr:MULTISPECIES: hypothetical protein [unclassified Brevundimonas]MCK6104286.1 hypothetical protein [Brevundimonas sp. EYE_349]